MAKNINPIRLFTVLIEAGYNVAYLDCDEERRKVVQSIISSGYGRGTGTARTGKPTAEAILHHDITLVVNKEEFGNEDWLAISPTYVSVTVRKL